MNQRRSMGMGCRAFVLVVGLASALATPSASADPFGGLGGLLGGFGNQGQGQGQGQNNGNQGGKKKHPLTMVLPYQSMPLIQSTNKSVNFNKIGVSQAAFGNYISQAAIVSASQVGGGAPGMMFLPYGQLGGIQSANLDLNFNVIAVTQLAVGRNINQVALVNVSQANGGAAEDDKDDYGDDSYGDDSYGGSQGGQGGYGGSQGGQGGYGGGQGQQGGGKTTMVAPYDDVPLLKTLNSSMNFNVTRVTQVGIGSNISQAAILSVGQSNSQPASPLGTPMFIPASEVGAYKSLNLHLNINVIALTQVAIGNNINQLALITVGQSN